MMNSRLRDAGLAADATLRGALLSYQALFTWLNPLGYISSRVVRPIGLAVVFISLSAYYGAGIAHVLVGTSLLAGVSSVVFGMALSVGNERPFGTLAIWLASPQDKLAATCQRALPHVADGFVGGLWTYLVCCLLYGILPVPVPMYCALLAIGVVSTFGFSLSLAAAAMVFRDVFAAPNIAELVLMLFSGTLIETARLPVFARPIAQAVPLNHIMDIVGIFLVTRKWQLAPLGGEFAVALAWFLVGVVLIHLAVPLAKRQP